jgi:hypothetical protein
MKWFACFHQDWYAAEIEFTFDNIQVRLDNIARDTNLLFSMAKNFEAEFNVEFNQFNRCYSNVNVGLSSSCDKTIGRIDDNARTWTRSDYLLTNERIALDSTSDAHLIEKMIGAFVDNSERFGRCHIDRY